MPRVRPLSRKTSRRHRLERGLVWLKYLSPAILTLVSWFSCLVKCIRFNDGETLRSLQSVNDMVSQALRGVSSFDSAKDDEYTALLANALEPAADFYVWSFIIAAVLSLYMLVFAIATLPGDPLSPATNRAKIWFKTFFPSKILLIPALILPVYPTFMPYIIRYLFFKYYVMDSLTLTAARFNPAVVVTVLAVILLAVFFIAIPFERRHRMDPFKRYDKEEEF